MTRVNINNHFHQVEIEGEGTPQVLANLAMKVYKETYDRDNKLAGGGLGFTGDRRFEFDLAPLDVK